MDVIRYLGRFIVNRRRFLSICHTTAWYLPSKSNHCTALYSPVATWYRVRENAQAAYELVRSTKAVEHINILLCATFIMKSRWILWHCTVGKILHYLSRSKSSLSTNLKLYQILHFFFCLLIPTFQLWQSLLLSLVFCWHFYSYSLRFSSSNEYFAGLTGTKIPNWANKILYEKFLDRPHIGKLQEIYKKNEFTWFNFKMLQLNIKLSIPQCIPTTTTTARIPSDQLLLHEPE